MKTLLSIVALLLVAVLSPTLGLAQDIQVTDILVAPITNPDFFGGFICGDGDMSDPMQSLDWSIGNSRPFSDTRTDDMVFSTCEGSLANPADWKERMRITKSGNVGIGTVSPASRLDVAGTVTATAFVGNGAGLTGLPPGPAGPKGDPGPPGASPFVVSGTDVYYTAGNVGIGTTSPVWELEVANLTPGGGTESGVTANDAGGAIAAYSSTLPAPFAHYAGRVSLFSNAATMGLDLRADGSGSDIRFYSGGFASSNERMRVTANGFVGIGTTDALWQLHVKNPNEGHINIMVEDNDGMWGTFGVNDVGNYAAISHGQGINQYWDTIVLKSSNVGIGTTNPLSKLSVGGDGSTNAAIYGESEKGHGVMGLHTHPTQTEPAVYGRNTGSGPGVDGTSTYHQGVVGWGGAGSYDFYAKGPGEDYGSSSSIRWKRNIVKIDNPLNKLNEIRGVYFDWDEEHGGQRDVGCIAEEVGKVLPEIVVYEKNGTDATGMDYSKLTPLLIEAIKTLEKRIEELEKKSTP